jgi:hypothetical protein
LCRLRTVLIRDDRDEIAQSLRHPRFPGWISPETLAKPPRADIEEGALRR